MTQQRRNAPDLAGQDFSHLAAAEFPFRIRPPGRQVDDTAVSGDAGVQVQKTDATFPAQEHQALVDHDARQPVRELGFPLKLVKVLKSLPDRILGLVLRVSVIPEYEGCQADAPVSMSLHQLGKSPFVTPTAALP